MRTRVPVTLLAAAALLVAPATKRERVWESIARRLAGSYSSEAQSRLDPDYFDVRCEIVPFWKGRPGFGWLYVEGSVPGLQEAPYRQTVYRLGDDPSIPHDERRFELRAYAVVDPRRVAGAALDPVRLEALTDADLAPQPGCSIVLVRGDDDTFTGGTRGRACPGSAPGVAYVTSEWTVGRDGLTRWDRGFDAEGRQVWGATKGPYVLRRVVAFSSVESPP
jgi:hypothetical protein